MNKRLLIWTGGVLMLALVALFPLRLALHLTDMERIGFTARQVAGTIWYGRIGDLQLRSHSLGTFEVEADALSLLLGRPSMRISRMDSPDGVMSGQLFAGLERGVKGMNGRLAVGAMLAPIPIEAVELKGVTLVFRNGYCVQAGGEVTPVMALPVAEMAFGPGASGAVSCEGKRARVVMKSASGRERIDFYVNSDGRYRGWMIIADTSAAVGAALAPLGFRSTAQGLALSVEGRL